MIDVTDVKKVCLYLFTLFAMDYSLFPSWSMWYMDFGAFGIWIVSFWRRHMSFGITSHCIAWHLELCREPMVATVPVQHRLLGITMRLHTLLGMKAGVHMHPYAYIIIGLALQCNFIP